MHKKLLEHLPLIYYMIIRIVGYDKHKEYLSSGYFGAMKAMESFDPDKGKFSTYLGNGVYFGVLNQLNREKRFENHNIQLFDIPPISEKEDSIYLDDFGKALERLPERDVFILDCISKGIELRKIATILNISYQRVSQLKKRAIEKIKHAA